MVRIKREGADEELGCIERRHLAGHDGPLSGLYGNLEVVMEEEQLETYLPAWVHPGAVLAVIQFWEGLVDSYGLTPSSELTEHQEMGRWRRTVDYLGIELPVVIGDLLVQRRRIPPALGGHARDLHLRISARVFGDRLMCHLIHSTGQNSCGPHKLTFELIPGAYDPICEKVHLSDFTSEPGLKYLKDHLWGLYNMAVGLEVVETGPDVVGLSRQTFQQQWAGGGEMMTVTDGLRYGHNSLVLNPGQMGRALVMFRRDVDSEQVVELDGLTGSWKLAYQKSRHLPNDPGFTSNNFEVKRYMWSSRVCMSATTALLAKPLPRWGVEKVIFASQEEVDDDAWRATLLDEPLPERCGNVLHNGVYETTPAERGSLDKTRESHPHMVVVVSVMSKFPLIKFDTVHDMVPSEGRKPPRKEMLEVTLTHAAFDDDTIESIAAMMLG